jgi:hypothetical protein
MTVELDGSIRIAWSAEGHDMIRVYAPRRPPEELAAFARRVADHALVNRSVRELRVVLRSEFDATFDIDSRRARVGDPPFVLVRLHPPPGIPNTED